MASQIDLEDFISQQQRRLDAMKSLEEKKFVRFPSIRAKLVWAQQNCLPDNYETWRAIERLYERTFESPYLDK